MKLGNNIKELNNINWFNKLVVVTIFISISLIFFFLLKYSIGVMVSNFNDLNNHNKYILFEILYYVLFATVLILGWFLGSNFSDLRWLDIISIVTIIIFLAVFSAYLKIAILSNYL